MSPKKVGIITFHDSRNYGAVLQAYALQKKVSEYFPNTEIINYQNPEIEKDLKLWNYSGGIKGLLKAALSFVFRFRKKIAFDSFLNKYIPMSPSVNSGNIKRFSLKYDIVITGSDQVWNTVLTKDDMQYFLPFCSSKHYRMAYAASFGDKKISLSDDVKKEISKFSLITLREDDMLEEVRDAAQCPVGIACDPSFLLKRSEWRKLCSKRLLKSKYVFLFMIDDSAELRKYAERYAKKNGLKLVSNKNDINFFLHSSPMDFLSWILNAECIITNSFHGTVFSIIFHKKFVSHLRNTKGVPKQRIINLLEQFRLSHRNTDNAQLNMNQEEDWKYADEKIMQLKSRSWKQMKEKFDEIIGESNAR